MALDPLTAALDLAGQAIDRIWPDKTEQEKAERALLVATVQGQLAVNQQEAQHPSIFVSGWRPAIGWVCGGACAWNWIGLPIAQAACVIAGYEIALDQADLTEMLPILIGMLGLGGLRTYERVAGVARQ
jgi:hypothetical protein